MYTTVTLMQGSVHWTEATAFVTKKESVWLIVHFQAYILLV